MSLNLLILGAGGNSREVAEAALDLGYCVIGFMDDDPAKTGTLIDGLPVLGPISMAASRSESCICALAAYRRPRLRQSYLAELKISRQRWAIIIHPKANVARSAKIGIGSVVLAGAFVGAGATIGDHVILLQGACVSHDCTIGNYVTITSGTCLAGTVRVEEAAYIGMGSMIRNGIAVGAGALVGMGRGDSGCTC